MSCNDESRWRVTGSFVEPDEGGKALSAAIGRAVMGAAALEAAMRVEAARLLYRQGDESLPDELTKMGRETGGDLLQRLRKLDLPADLCGRILDAVERRNQIVHRPFEDAELARVTAGVGDIQAVVDRIERLALDCGELAVELEMFAIPKILEMTGMSLTQIADLFKGMDSNAFAGHRDRKQLEALQAFLELEDLSTTFREMGLGDE